VKGVREDSVRALVAARREGGGFASVGDLAARSGADGPTLEKLAWAGACDRLEPGGRRAALWTLGAAPTGEPVGEDGAQLALPLEPLPAPELRRMSSWQTLLADYGATGLTVGEHPLAMLRAGLREQLGERLKAATELDRLKEGTRVSVAGLVVARQRPGTAKGVVFVLLEDETGTVNVVLPPPVYDEYRAVARSEPLLVVDGRLELRTGAVNVLARGLRAIEPFDSSQSATRVRRLRTAQGEGDDERKDRQGVADIRAVAPVGLNFGRRGR
jgi:error-prone DNA polymerase